MFTKMTLILLFGAGLAIAAIGTSPAIDTSIDNCCEQEFACCDEGGVCCDLEGIESACCEQELDCCGTGECCEPASCCKSEAGSEH